MTGSRSPIDRGLHPIHDLHYAEECRRQLETAGALVLPAFFTASAVAEIVEEVASREADAFFADSTHNVFLTPPDPDLPAEHAFNRQVVSTKGLIADDQISANSLLRVVYDDPSFRVFVSRLLGIDAVYSYADDLSSINVHFAPEGRELGWHFDNSSFAVTMLLRAPDEGGRFEYVANARAFARVDAILDGREPVTTLEFDAGDLVVFRGREALHRVTPTVGPTTRLLAVFAFNDEPGVCLSDSALATFYGRSGATRPPP